MPRSGTGRKEEAMKLDDLMNAARDSVSVKRVYAEPFALV